MIVTSQLFILKTLIDCRSSLIAALTAALLTADPLALGTAGVIHAQTLDGKTELLDALSVASLELLSSSAAAFMESVSFKISINNVSVSILSINLMF